MHLGLLLLLLPWGGDLMRTLTQGKPQHAVGGGGGGGGGGERVAYISLPALRPSVPETKPEPQPVVPPPVVVPPPPSKPDLPARVDSAVSTAVAPNPAGADTAAGEGPGAGGGTGGGTGGGNGPGTGTGTGPGDGGGEGGLGKPPVMQRFVPIGDRPKELHGQIVKVTFWLDSAGTVKRVIVVPEIRDRGFAKKFLETLESFRFHPARGPDGFPIASTYTIDFTL